MRALTLLRHARADWPAGRYADRDRPLDPRGVGDAKAAAQALAGAPRRPTLVLASPAQRTLETARILCAALALPPPALCEDERLYLASRDTLLQVLQELDSGARSVALVGHNPGLSELAAHLSPAGHPSLATAQFLRLFLPITSWTALR